MKKDHKVKLVDTKHNPEYRRYGLPLEVAISENRFPILNFALLAKNAREVSLYPINERVEVSWVLLLTTKQYENLGKPETITGPEIIKSYEPIAITSAFYRTRCP